ncbi:unnamed protein product [Ambrosiozyma monospora]|uniref:Unnamed protein product n=1 Tax=Ambrosiozyma monospora TaxID=43982 RepID=A0A9W6YZ89_AMBMO|nr:unnamed protein product [Ambrosiozyma monospora]
MQEELLATRKHLFTEQNTGTSIAGSPLPLRRLSLLTQTDESSQTTATGTNAVDEATCIDSSLKIGTAMDFYQRELHIIRNELDFSEYTREASIWEINKIQKQLNEKEQEVYGLESLKKENEALKLEIKKLVGKKDAYDSSGKPPEMVSNLNFIESSLKLQSENNELKEKVGLLTEQLETHSVNLDKIKSSLKGAEIAKTQLADRLKFLESEHERDEYRRGDQIAESTHATNFQTTPNERKIVFLNQQVERLQLESIRTKDKLEKSYEEKLQHLERQLQQYKEAELRTNNSLVKAVLNNNESKLISLQTTVDQLQAELRNKEEIIRELSTTKPISIARSSPLLGSPARQSSLMMETSGSPELPGFKQHYQGYMSGIPANELADFGVSDHPNHQHPPRSTSSIPQLHRHMHRSDSDNYIPPATITIKGRGGIQKKSKFKM